MNTKGTLHPLTIVMDEIVNIFAAQGFSVALGPELEDEWHNFDALNVPKDHPARDMQDTFWIKDQPGKLLRTHTSPVQIRYMETHQPPFAIIVPGKVFRNEATDAGHEMQFYQVEGLVVGEGVTIEHLKGTLFSFYKKLLGEDVEIRFRPSFFPFTEPSIEVDVKFNGKWFEMMGGGMVNPAVLKNGGVDPEKYSGFAFGGGIDRLAMVRYGITDIRLFYQGDLRINQF
jgi:phenylalanyl-tRNA synthetase alpha chain